MMIVKLVVSFACLAGSHAFITGGGATSLRHGAWQPGCSAGLSMAKSSRTNPAATMPILALSGQPCSMDAGLLSTWRSKSKSNWQHNNLARAHIGSASTWQAQLQHDGGGGGRDGIARRSGGGGGGGEGGDGKDEEGEIAALLKQYGLLASQLPRGAEALDAKKLGRFLAAYSNSLNKWLTNMWPAWRDKMLADPEFAYKLMVEETVGLGLAMSGTVAARGKDILKELDFFFTDCAVGAVINFVIIWLLAPSVARSAAGASSIAGRLAKLPSYVLAEGKYSVAQRMGAGIYKGVLFSGCGFLGSLGGTTIAYLLFQIRRLASQGNAAKDGPLPNVVANSLGWGSFMFVSTNPRYQLLNGIEQVMYKVLPTSVSKGGSLVLRTGNNIVGGATWVMWARFIGLQKQKEAQLASKKTTDAKKGKK